MSIGPRDNDDRPVGDTTPTGPPAGDNRVDTASTPDREHPTFEEVPVVDIPGIGKVIPLRPVPEPRSAEPGTELVPDDAIEGELLDDEQNRALGRRLPTPMLRRVRAVSAQRTVRVVRTVVTHDRTKTTGKAALRNALYVPIGVQVLAKRVWEAKTNSRYERLIRRAEAAGKYDELLEWERRAEHAKQRRHARVMDWVKAPWQLAKALVAVVASLFGLLLALGIVLAISASDPNRVLGPIEGVLAAIEWTAWAVAIAWGPLVLAAPWVTVLFLWHVGRTQGHTPGWIQAPTAADPSALVTADGIVRALQHLNISKMNEGFKGGWVPRFDLVPTREGQGAFKGFRAIFDLPDGVTPGMVADKQDVLAVNLRRNTVEVWPSDYGRERGGKAGYVNLYVADHGVMDKPTPEYPLMHDGAGDVFAGVPVGITQRGDVVVFSLVGSNFVFGGQPGQGKSNAARVVMVGAALDPLCELRVHVFANNGDFDSYQPRLTHYHKGATPEHAALATEHLQELFAEVGRREKRLADLGAKKLTRALAQQHRDLRPIEVLFSECHELFGDKDCGEEAADLAVRVVKRGRKTGITLGFDTQSSRTDAIPSQLVENVGINGCFAVKAWRSNDGFLGDGSFAAGIRATELRFNVDRGTMIATGVSDQLFEIVRTFFIEINDDTGWDAAGDIIDRAMTNLAAGTPAAGDRPAPQVEPARELLADLDEVLGDHPVPAADVPALLRELAPHWQPYRRMTGRALRERLAALGVKVPSTDRKYPIDPVTIRDARVRRETGDPDEED